MRKLVLLCLLMLGMTTATAQKQRGFVSTGNNVNVRKGPGKNYPVIFWEGQKLQLEKNEVVYDKGKRRNGFCYVTVNKVIPTVAVFTYDGWVSAQYLRPVTLCPECGGSGCVGDIEELKDCPRCKTKGFVK